MKKAAIADYIGKPDNAYALLTLLSDTTRLTVTHLLADLKREIGDGLWVMPPEALHITLCEIIQPKAYTKDKQAIYESNKEAYEHIPAKVLEEFGPIEVHFNKVVVSPQAITVQGQDDGSFNKIRQQLVEKLPLPSETKLPPNIVHSSIARFTQELDLEKIGQVIARHSIDCKEIVKEFKLVNNVAPPLLRYRTIQTYSLVK